MLPNLYFGLCGLFDINITFWEGVRGAKMNYHPPGHDLMDAYYNSVVDEPQLSSYLISPWLPIQYGVGLM